MDHSLVDGWMALIVTWLLDIQKEGLDNLDYESCHFGKPLPSGLFIETTLSEMVRRVLIHELGFFFNVCFLNCLEDMFGWSSMSNMNGMMDGYIS